MNKKIFITGKVRDFDSTDPKDFTDGIEEYIKNNIVDKELADIIKVNAYETAPNEISIDMLFGGSGGLGLDDITREMYRCFTGEYKGFVAENTIWWMAGFGPDYGMNVMFSITDTIAAHKKNTRFYKADRYKSITMRQTISGLHIVIGF